jgi:hypothetical protein
VTDIPQIAEDINVTAPEAHATEEPKRSRRKAAEAVSLDDL